MPSPWTVRHKCCAPTSWGFEYNHPWQRSVDIFDTAYLEDSVASNMINFCFNRNALGDGYDRVGNNNYACTWNHPGMPTGDDPNGTIQYQEWSTWNSYPPPNHPTEYGEDCPTCFCPEGSEIWFHDDNECRTSATGHNVVWDYAENWVHSMAPGAEGDTPTSHRFYPYWDWNISGSQGQKYLYKLNGDQVNDRLFYPMCPIGPNHTKENPEYTDTILPDGSPCVYVDAEEYNFPAIDRDWMLSTNYVFDIPDDQPGGGTGMMGTHKVKVSPGATLNEAYDRYQKGVKMNGTVLYDLPVYTRPDVNYTLFVHTAYQEYCAQNPHICDPQIFGGDTAAYPDAGTRWAFNIDKFNHHSADTDGPNRGSQVKYGNTAALGGHPGASFGVGTCGPGLTDPEVSALLTGQFTAAYLTQFLRMPNKQDDYNVDTFAANSDDSAVSQVNQQGQAYSYIHNIPSAENGFGLQWFLDQTDNLNFDGYWSVEAGVDTWNENPVFAYLGWIETPLLLDLMIRLGFPMPPILLFGSANPDFDCTLVGDSWEILRNEWTQFIGIGMFFSDFDLPGIKVKPTMVNELDVASGIDLREENLDGCDYIQFLTFPKENPDIMNPGGDAIYYRSEDIPDMYFDTNNSIGQFNNAEEDYIRNFQCETVLDRDLQFNIIRAACKDGSYAVVAHTGNNNDDIIEFDGSNVKYSTGREACNSTFKLNSSNDLYYLADSDGRESLGIFFPDNRNRTENDFVSRIRDDSFVQYPLTSYLINGGGLNLDDTYEWDQPYNIAAGWAPIYGSLNTLKMPPSGSMPYFAVGESECFSYGKCLVIDTTHDNNGVYDNRQGISTIIEKNDLPDDAKRKNQQFKVSFMMKTYTQTLSDGSSIDLNDTGIQLVGSWEDWSQEHGNGGVNNQHNYSTSPVAGVGYDIIKPETNSQCSPKSHPNGIFGQHYVNHNDSPISDIEEAYCNRIKASFTNTKEGVWEKMEFIFTPEMMTYDWQIQEADLKNFNNFDLKLIFLPLHFGKYWDGLLEFPGQYQGNISQLQKGASKIYLDNFEFTEDFSFHPDVDVRKRKGSNDYGLSSLTEYNDIQNEDSQAPLQAQFYFYPRIFHDDVFSSKRTPFLEKFKYGQFYITDVDWGDGSPKEYVEEPKQLGTNVMLYHSYKSSGIFEIKGTMLQIKPEIYNYHRDIPERIKYEGNLGVGHNKRFSVKILVNEGPDEDFTYFGSDGFSFIPYRNTLPIIGGYGKRSIYYKSIKRNLGILEGDIKVDINYKNTYDRFKAEAALMKMDSSLEDKLDFYNEYKQPIELDLDITDDFLKTLPFPRHLEEFDINSDGVVTKYGTSGNTDRERWYYAGRPDIANFMLTDDYENVDPVGAPFYYSYSPEIFINPTADISQNKYIPGNRTGLVEQLGQTIGDMDISMIKYYKGSFGMWEILGFADEDDEMIHPGNPASVRYWKNIIPKDYSIFNRDGVYSKHVDIYSEQDWIDVEGTIEASTGCDLPSNTIYLDVVNSSLQIYNVLYNSDTDIAGFQFSLPVPVISATGGDAEEAGFEIESNQEGTVLGFSFTNTPIPAGCGTLLTVELGGDASIINNVVISDVFGNNLNFSDINHIGGNGVPDYYYPVLPRYGADGRFIEDDYPNDKIPFPLIAPITDESERVEAAALGRTLPRYLVVNITSNKIDKDIFNDNTGNNNNGFIISDYKPKFDDETFEVKKTKKMNKIKTSTKNRAF